MFNNVKINERISWIGVNDRTTHLFEALWPIPNGVAYNTYLIQDEKTALLDTMKLGFGKDFQERVTETLGDRVLDYLIIHHMEPDHAGEIKSIVKKYPNVKIVGNNKTFKVLESYFGKMDNLMEVKEGDVLDLGHHKLKFVFMPWVHWPEVMVSYDLTEGILFSADAFGTFGTLDGGIFDDEVLFDKYYEDDMRRYYSNIVGKYSSFVQKAFCKLAGVNIRMICPLHGPIWRTNVAKVLGLYDKWSKMEADDAVVIIYGSMYGNTAVMADYIARQLAEQGIKDIRVYDASKTHISYLISEVWRCKGVILGSPAYNSCMFPMIENLTRELEHKGLKNRYLGVFGTYSWNGGGVRNLLNFADNIKWEMVGQPAEIEGSVMDSKIALAKELALEMAQKIKSVSCAECKCKN